MISGDLYVCAQKQRSNGNMHEWENNYVYIGFYDLIFSAYVK